LKEKNLKNKIVNAAKWSTITEVFAKLVSPLTTMILARIIAPEAFGVVVTITMIISFADMITDSGFQKYLIQHKFKNEDEKFKYANVAFWTNLGISIFLWLIIIVFSEQIALLVGNPGLGNVISIACVQLIFTAFSSIQMALYRRDFDFKTLFLVRMVGICLPFIVTIPLALLGIGYWSLIIGTICMQISNAVILTYKSKWKPNLFYNVKILKKMLAFSIWSLIEAISIWLTSWVDIFIIGSLLNQHYLGLYKISTTMVTTLMALVTASLLPVLFSALSRYQDDNIKFTKMYFTAQRAVSVLIFPIGVGLYLYSDLATTILLGNQWNEAGNIIGIWALTNSIKIVFGNLCSEAYRAKGRPKLSFLAQLLHLVALVPVCIISSEYGFWVLVYARALIRIQFVIVHFVIMRLAMGISIRNTIRNVLPTGISATFMGVVGYQIQQISSGILWSCISIVICSLFYFGLLYVFPSMRKEMNMVMGKLRVRFSGGKHLTT
jgi:O-antigen/teichoic acid export membrane protein